MPTYDFIIKEENGIRQIKDKCRNRFVKLTPEEWVRQNMVEYLIREKNYPQNLIVNEATVELNGMKKRCDTVIYDKKGTPRVIVEYKAPTVKITQKVFDQIANYNIKLKVEYLVVSNGIRHYCCRINDNGDGFLFEQEIPLCKFI